MEYAITIYFCTYLFLYFNVQATCTQLSPIKDKTCTQLSPIKDKICQCHRVFLALKLFLEQFSVP